MGSLKKTILIEYTRKEKTPYNGVQLYSQICVQRPPLPCNPKFVVVVDKWSMFRGSFMQSKVLSKKLKFTLYKGK
jgi:hypothetical protein